MLGAGHGDYLKKEEERRRRRRRRMTYCVAIESIIMKTL